MAENKVEIAVTGKTKVFVVPPPPMTKEEIDRVLRDYHTAGWAIIESMNKKKRAQRD